MRAVAAVLLDIEGTTTPKSFVQNTLFPFARERLEGFIAAHTREPEAAAHLDAVRKAVPGREPIATLLHWMDEDARATPLMALQGMIWDEGYASHAIRGELYPDVSDCLRGWSAAGIKLFVYSSGSVATQRMLFRHSVAGDLSGLFAGFFDTRMGSKRDAESYDRIAIAAGVPAPAMLFLSDTEAELDAAAAAGLRTCQLVRPDSGTSKGGALDDMAAGSRHPVAGDFAEIGRRFDLA